MLAARSRFVVSEALLAEYRDVLARPKLCKVHGLNPAERESLLTEIVQHAIVLRSVATHPAPDPATSAFGSLLLVTGDNCSSTTSRCARGC
ncbi:hypothetical protein [Lysobacter sp. F60174L2]|uniref:hypothetical protein n=1 Tax=Lysobacter sp. F60174L2 TaxID=3459295 RepID=UPI00403DF9CF